MKKEVRNYQVVTKDGEVVCDDCTFVEAAQCRKELIELDKADGTYEQGFYILKRV